MARIMLVNMPTRMNEPARHIPIGIAQLASVLDQEGHAVVILDANCYKLNRDLIRKDLKDESEFVKGQFQLKPDDPPFDIIGLSGMVTTYSMQKELIPWIKKDHPKSLLIAGGGCASSVPVEMMGWNPDLDLAIIGEGEKTILQIVEHLEDRDWSKVKGIAYREGMEIRRTEPQPLLTEKEMDDLPYPSWDLLPLEDPERPMFGYFANSPFLMFLPRRRLSMIASRGCPFSCTFCTDILSGQNRTAWKGTKGTKKIRYHSPKYVVDMIKAARFRHCIDFVSFCDECLTTNRTWMLKFCELLETEDLPKYIQWGCTAHARTVDRELLGKMREAGCQYLDFGFESGDNRILKSIKKGSTSELNQKALDTCIEATINPITNFMIGYPQEDFGSIMASVNFWIKNNIRCKPFFVTPFPMTKLFEEQKQKILAQYNNSLEEYVLSLGEATDLHVNLTRYSDPELIGIQELMSKHDVKRLEKWGKVSGELK